ncbi:hypothetical protein C7U92_31795 [Bradyrhizobium sp. WBOS7]|uniref:Uncharacterized protein n=1 Tax=Bradyrhizobium betae TaxID=244734 RepID=A0AAE9N6T4_9BRAD|nr:hypothetical protein [Bradyrhizobium sp. WBOS2]MDD1572821.1 hypothetical protein [Bradyrhizobium sp. WBOS1]MDD1581271.1 hypothetical protein [Bradyrhizobium sp. WBOS7]MDD1604999.1 hypothetical protein [Bradyrhizobium sp. WBOS16]UUO33309.1 hypothetical protein DCK84_01055 [Bradyrhizobium sp. WBOS01]UUO39488.1 hypothetical protein DCM75_01055 [Bradyrhizobium sp. WBOS02]UUO51719.1 hypothetical protein DCM79_01055 [Bradyrhizobium sp. WBOS07]UUO63955.1 hypothetical protein DCM83_01055 [Bradyrh
MGPWLRAARAARGRRAHPRLISRVTSRALRARSSQPGPRRKWRGFVFWGTGFLPLPLAGEGRGEGLSTSGQSLCGESPHPALRADLPRKRERCTTLAATAHLLTFEPLSFPGRRMVAARRGNDDPAITGRPARLPGLFLHRADRDRCVSARLYPHHRA